MHGLPLFISTICPIINPPSSMRCILLNNRLLYPLGYLNENFKPPKVTISTGRKLRYNHKPRASVRTILALASGLMLLISIIFFLF